MSAGVAVVRLTFVGDSTPACTSLTVSSASRVRQLAVAVRLHSIAAKVMYCTSLAGLACGSGGGDGMEIGGGGEMVGRWGGRRRAGCGGGGGVQGGACWSVSRWTSWWRSWYDRCGAAGLNSAQEAALPGSYRETYLVRSGLGLGLG